MPFKFTLFFLLIFLILTIDITADNPDVHIITLRVDTGRINNSNVTDVCNFGQDPSLSNEEYTIVVKRGDIVMWKGESSTAPDKDIVLIASINHEGGQRVFSSNRLSDSRDNPGVVMGTVTEGREGDEQKYKVSFKVLNDGVKRNGTFHIDPKIIVK